MSCSCNGECSCSKFASKPLSVERLAKELHDIFHINCDGRLAQYVQPWDGLPESEKQKLLDLAEFMSSTYFITSMIKTGDTPVDGLGTKL